MMDEVNPPPTNSGKGALRQEDLDLLLKPKLKLFLSVDVVGSSRYKQDGNRSKTQHWLAFFVNFFRDFPGFLDSELAALRSHEPGYACEPVNVWKALGDELLFTVELKKLKDAHVYLKAFEGALRASINNWKSGNSKEAEHDLSLKGAAWLAGFPVGNAEIPLFNAKANGLAPGQRDYIGPAIDTGFRVKDFATQRKLVITADLALLLLSEAPLDWDYFFDGEQVLKGVMKGRPYPIIWIECNGHAVERADASQAQMNKTRDLLTGKVSASPKILKDYLEAWFEHNKEHINKPFIYEDKSAIFEPPSSYDMKLREVKEVISQSFYVTDDVDVNSGDQELKSSLKELLGRLMSESGQPATRSTQESEIDGLIGKQA